MSGRVKGKLKPGERVTPEMAARIKRLCEVHPQEVAAQIVGVSDDTVTRLKQRGWKAYDQVCRQRPMPGDFPIQCNRMTIIELARHYRTNLKVVYRWLAGIERDYQPRSTGRPQRERPPRAELIKALAEHSVTETAAIFGVHANTLMAWRLEYGLPVTRKRKLETVKRAAEKGVGWIDDYLLRRAA